MTANLNDPATPTPAPHHHRHPRDTEVAAAQLITPIAGTLRCIALDAFRDAGPRGLTDQELAGATGRYLYTIAPRRVELVQQGWVQDSGARRRGVRGRSAVVWALTSEALHRVADVAS